MIKCLLHDMTISIIIPCLYKDDRTCRLIDEITRQSKNSSVNPELILIEGISPCPKARNAALRQVNGDYIAWVDSDDEITPEWWKSITEALSTSPDVVTFAWYDEKLNREEAYVAPNPNDPSRLLHAVLRDNAPGSYLWNKVIKRKFWDGKWFDEKYRLLTDFDLLPQVLKETRTIRTLNTPLYRYRYEPNSVCRGNFENRDEQLFEIMLKRVTEWMSTQYEKDTVIPLSRQVSYRLVKLMNRGDNPTLDPLLNRSRKILKRHLLFLLSCHDLWVGDKLRVLSVAINSLRFMQFTHRIHRMFCP